MADTYFTLLQRKIDEYEEDIKISSVVKLRRSIIIVGRYEALQFVKQDINDLEKRYIEE